MANESIAGEFGGDEPGFLDGEDISKLPKQKRTVRYEEPFAEYNARMNANLQKRTWADDQDALQAKEVARIESWNKTNAVKKVLTDIRKEPPPFLKAKGEKKNTGPVKAAKTLR